jgi:hypothetical protein
LSNFARLFLGAFSSTEISETESQNMTALEGNVRRKMHQEDANVLDNALIPSGDVSLQKAMREMRARYEVSKTHSYLSQSYSMISSSNRLTSNSYGSA